MRKAHLAILAAMWALSVGTTGAALALHPGEAGITPRSAAPALQEDDPGWDCRTMGNRVCGVSRQPR